MLTFAHRLRQRHQTEASFPESWTGLGPSSAEEAEIYIREWRNGMIAFVN